MTEYEEDFTGETRVTVTMTPRHGTRYRVVRNGPGFAPVYDRVEDAARCLEKWVGFHGPDAGVRIEPITTSV
ncbi:hypothetical protein AB1046_06305 [Promicromonospora sp. Populi]|uniref:hypothetical protein n=1 Tax=Promicromonospora sp. Populi TaxID=3239420 RepID=UPI0034E206D7